LPDENTGPTVKTQAPTIEQNALFVKTFAIPQTRHRQSSFFGLSGYAGYHKIVLPAIQQDRCSNVAGN
jgi:hypothetical protein